jgi:DNA-binding PadR family transcriptional regulator
MYTDDEVKTLVQDAEATKFRIFMQGDLAVLAYIKNLNGQASASQLVLAITLARGKMVSLAQIAPILKALQKWSCVTTVKVKANNRAISVYKLTDKGSKVLALGTQLINTLGTKTVRKNK